ARFGSTPSIGWTPWQALSYRRIARLASVNKDSLTKVFAVLKGAGLAEHRALSATRVSERPGEWRYRLSAELYKPRGDRAPFTRLRGSLFYGGLWAVLPSHAARNL